MHTVIKFNQKAWLKSYIDLNTELGKKAQNGFFKLMNNTVFGKTLENVKNHSDIKLITNEARRNYLVSKLNYHTAIFSLENLLAIEMKKTQIFLN